MTFQRLAYVTSRAAHLARIRELRRAPLTPRAAAELAKRRRMLAALRRTADFRGPPREQPQLNPL